MYKIESQFSFDSAHFLKDHPRKCKFIHGHRFKVEVELSGEELVNDMVMDFTDLKNYLKILEDKFDHTLIIEEGSISDNFMSAFLQEGFSLTEVNFRPTAENFSKHFFTIIDNKFGNVSKVTVYETPTNKASYERGR